MEQTVTKAAEDASDQDVFTRVSQAGWNGFTKFLLLNVVVVIVALIIIGFLTVWS
jgi:hypothetical protein